jgi:UDPglucose--hexose-1-phosphate uridylyltransferase
MLKCFNVSFCLSANNMPYNELRKDYLLNRWVVIATERSRRPSDFAKQKLENSKNAVCPLCVGNENMTPPAMMLYLKEDNGVEKSKDSPNGERSRNWLVRCIPNLYPAFSQPTQPADIAQIVRSESFSYAIGNHEVLVESPNHDEDPADSELPQLELVINAYIDRLRDLSAKPYIKYVSIFRNYGKEAGASLSHAHSQIIATPMVPTTIQEELDTSKTFYKKHGKCVFCDIVEKETKGPRFVCENSDLIVFTPYASITPMTFWIMPKRHEQNILNLKQSEISVFAQTLKASLKALEDLVNDPPYNYGFHLAIDSEAQDYYHWHLEVYPKLSIWAGFEISTGIYINTVTPETAAENLKKAITL